MVEITEEMVQRAANAIVDEHKRCARPAGPSSCARAALAAALPLIEAAVRAEYNRVMRVAWNDELAQRIEDAIREGQRP